MIPPAFSSSAWVTIQSFPTTLCWPTLKSTMWQGTEQWKKPAFTAPVANTHIKGSFINLLFLLANVIHLPQRHIWLPRHLLATPMLEEACLLLGTYMLLCVNIIHTLLLSLSPLFALISNCYRRVFMRENAGSSTPCTSLYSWQF